MVEELLSPLFSNPWGRRAGLFVMVLMALLTLATLIDMAFEWRSDIKLTQSVANPNEVKIDHASQLQKQIAQIPEWHLFGKYGVAESAMLPVTSLQIRLLGVIKSSPEKLSRVIISESGQPGKIYEVGDTLPSTGVKVYSITVDGVVLDNSGRLEKLPLQRMQLQFQGMPKSLLGE
jgi:general secretion pathway protein C